MKESRVKEFIREVLAEHRIHYHSESSLIMLDCPKCKTHTVGYRCKDTVGNFLFKPPGVFECLSCHFKFSQSEEPRWEEVV